MRRRPSSIDRLPREVREELQVWLRDPGLTQIEATGMLNARLEELGRPERIKRRVVSRYDKRRREAANHEKDLESLSGFAAAVEKLRLEAQRLRKTMRKILGRLEEGENRQ